MQNVKEQPKTIVLPIRFTVAQYADLAALAVLDQRTRCSVIRKLIADAAQRARREQGGPDAA